MKRLFLLTVVSGGLVLLASCQKPTDCRATVHCVDSTGAALKNSSVLLYAKINNHTADVKAEGTTDQNGTVTFTFKLPAVFDIKATGASNAKPVSGSGLIRLEEGQGSEKTITLR